MCFRCRLKLKVLSIAVTHVIFVLPGNSPGLRYVCLLFCCLVRTQLCGSEWHFAAVHDTLLVLVLWSQGWCWPMTCPELETEAVPH